MSAVRTLDELRAPPSGELWIEGLAIVDADLALTSATVIIARDELLYVGPSEAAPTPVGSVTRIDGSGWLAAPGLINAHTHCPMSFFRGLGHGRKNLIETFLFPAEKALTPEIIEPLCWSYIYSGLRSGVTCFVDHYYYSAGVAAALERFGLRGVIGETVADLGGAFPGRASWERARGMIDAWSYSPRIRPALAPHAADTVSRELLTEIAMFATANKLPIHMHLSQTDGEMARVQAREKTTPVKFAESCGALGPETLAVHLVSATPDDCLILARSGATAGICPASQVVYERLAPLAALADAGVPMALGTDCAASNDSADMLSEIKLAALLLRDRSASAELSSHTAAERALAMATINPAKAFGLGNQIGKLESGRLADVIFLRLDLATLPLHDPLTTLVYSCGAGQVRHVMVGGEWVLWNQRLVAENEDDLVDGYADAVRRITQAAGLSAPSDAGATSRET